MCVWDPRLVRTWNCVQDMMLSPPCLTAALFICGSRPPAHLHHFWSLESTSENRLKEGMISSEGHTNTLFSLVWSRVERFPSWLCLLLGSQEKQDLLALAADKVETLRVRQRQNKTSTFSCYKNIKKNVWMSGAGFHKPTHKHVSVFMYSTLVLWGCFLNHRSK